MAGKARLREWSPSTKEHDYSYEEAARDFQHIVKFHKAKGWTSHPMFKNS